LEHCELTASFITIFRTDAVKDPNTALKTVVEDWIESYKEDSGPAMAELVNFVLRVRLGSSPWSRRAAQEHDTDRRSAPGAQCCGCNATIDEHQAEDENGIVENLKDIVDEFKQVRSRRRTARTARARDADLL
jgi:cohesin complex subunit SA-1/2